MKKKAQFFLIATFIVITLFISLTLVYNDAVSPVGDHNIYSIAKNLKSEGVNIINNGYNRNLDYAAITENLKGFTNIASQSFKFYNIAIITFSADRLNYNAYNYVNGAEGDLTSRLTYYPDYDDVTLNLNSLNYNFELSKGYNFFVIVVNEKQNERYIVSE